MRKRVKTVQSDMRDTLGSFFVSGNEKTAVCHSAKTAGMQQMNSICCMTGDQGV